MNQECLKKYKTEQGEFKEWMFVCSLVSAYSALGRQNGTHDPKHRYELAWRMPQVFPWVFDDKLSGSTLKSLGELGVLNKLPGAWPHFSALQGNKFSPMYRFFTSNVSNSALFGAIENALQGADGELAARNLRPYMLFPTLIGGDMPDWSLLPRHTGIHISLTII